MYLVASLTSQRDGLKAKLASLRQLVERMPALKAEFQQLQSGTVETRENCHPSEVGVYQYRHPLDNAPAYKAKLVGLQAQIRGLGQGWAGCGGLSQLDRQWFSNQGLSHGEGTLQADAAGVQR